MKHPNIEHILCTIKPPTRLEQIDLERYKITHCIVFNSYQEIYDLIYEAAQEAEKITSPEIDRSRTYNFTSLSEKFALNKSYLFHGKSLINNDRSITRPYFFISRDVTDQLIKNLHIYSLQILLGGGCSGKTYVAIDVASRVRDRDVFVFESKESLSDDALQSLLNHGNCLIIADSNTLNIRQIERLIKSKDNLKKQNISILIIESKNNRDLAGLIQFLELNGAIEPKSIPQIVISNKFNTRETSELNQRLVTATLGVFSEEKTIADNIIECSHKLIQKNRFDKVVPHFANERQIACLIALATENKIYSSRAVELDLYPEIYEQERAKCYIRSACFETDTSKKLTFLENTYRDASVSLSVFENRYEDTRNEKLQISIAHVEYTKALVLCHQAKLNQYQSIIENTRAVETLYGALLSPYNSYDYVKSDVYNYGNVVMSLITTLIANSSLTDEKVHVLLARLFKDIKG